MSSFTLLIFINVISTILILLLSLNLSAATFHISTRGNDTNSGSSSSPWRTLQKGADTVSASDLVLVEGGEYDQTVTISNSGINENSRIIFKSAARYGAKCNGFKILGDFITIEGFTIEANSDNQYGIYVSSQNNVDIKDNHILECPGGGINITMGSTYCNIAGNILEHNGQWGIHVAGSHIVIENNEIFKTVQHHPKIEFTGFHGEDADGMRVFGDNHIIRGNYLHDLGNIEDPGNHQASQEYPHDFPHVDCLQSWDRSAHGGRPVIKQSTIENNYCSLSRASGKGLMISAIDSDCSDMKIINNIFEYRDIGISMNIGGFNNIYIYNNVFKANLNDSSWGTAVYLKDVNNYAVVNNIMVDGHAEARKILGGNGVVDYNLVWYSDGSIPRGTPSAAEHELWGVNPNFFSYSGESGGNYRFKVGSEAIDKGAALSVVSTDRDGNARPLGAGYDIGAYEYNSNQITYTLTYSAGNNGIIKGTSLQTVGHGFAGTTVTAVPGSGHHFVNWSDGVTENPRKDTHVTGNINVYANFITLFPWNLFLPAILKKAIN